MKDKQITLSGFGELEDAEDRKALARTAKEHGVEFYPTYYDHELRGSRKEIEAITKELWSLPSDQWAENALVEVEVDKN